ncbi:unnamed protein product [Calicophoron daubneyi]|uniref:Uncharacterized protein n=1 Tax=Calicophoron daubneyi TaxID=300641 RepID=A0AAV2TMP6_CALDB
MVSISDYLGVSGSSRDCDNLFLLDLFVPQVHWLCGNRSSRGGKFSIPSFEESGQTIGRFKSDYAQIGHQPDKLSHIHCFPICRTLLDGAVVDLELDRSIFWILLSWVIWIDCYHHHECRPLHAPHLRGLSG